MSMGAFTSLSGIYDPLSDKSYYDSYLKFILKAIEVNTKIPVSDILDLGCGTGSLSVLLEKEGYGMVCVDNSVEMLNVARERSESLLLINQSIADFELFGTVQAAISTLDTLNYLLSKRDVERCIKLTRNYLEKGGVFVFDVNTKHRYEHCYGERCFVYETDEGDTLVWENEYTPPIHSLILTMFKKREDGAFEKQTEVQTQRLYPIEEIQDILEKNGFSVLGIYGSTDLSELTETSEKAYFVARKEN